MKRPARGDIYWVKNVPSRDRWDNKTRPVVVIHVRGDSIIALAITTKFARPPKDYEIIIHDEGDTDETGLKDPSAAHCEWLLHLKTDDLDEFSGFVTKHIMDRILEQV